MNSLVLETFIAQAHASVEACTDPADCVTALAPLMLELLDKAGSFLEPCHYRSRLDHYGRNLVYAAPDASLSLYTLVWLPGQWTPIHDHGSWGVVGVLEGVVEERSFVRAPGDSLANGGIELVRSGVTLMASGSITSFVPDPDHIHVTGVPSGRPRALSLHLYGRMMDCYNTYDLALGTRQRVDLEHSES